MPEAPHQNHFRQIHFPLKEKNIYISLLSISKSHWRCTYSSFFSSSWFLSFFDSSSSFSSFLLHCRHCRHCRRCHHYHHCHHCLHSHTWISLTSLLSFRLSKKKEKIHTFFLCLFLDGFLFAFFAFFAF